METSRTNQPTTPLATEIEEEIKEKKFSVFLEEQFSQAYTPEPGIQNLAKKDNKTESPLSGRMHIDLVRSIGITIVLMVIAGVITFFAPEQTNSNQAANSKSIKNTVEVVVGVGTICGLFTTAFNIHYQNHYSRKHYSATYINRWLSREMTEEKENFRPIMEALENEDFDKLNHLIAEIKKKENTEKNKKNSVIILEKARKILNFFEQMSQDALTNVADSHYLKQFFWYTARRYYFCLEDVIKIYRKATGGDLYFAYFEDLMNEWEKEGKPLMVHHILNKK